MNLLSIYYIENVLVLNEIKNQELCYFLERENEESLKISGVYCNQERHRSTNDEFNNQYTSLHTNVERDL